MKDYYKVLQVPRTATVDQIKKAYRQLALALHPDIHKGDKTKESRFKEVAEAFEVLGSETRRHEYDRSCGFGTSSSTSSGSRAYKRYQGGSSYQPQARPVRSVDPMHFDVAAWNAWHYGENAVSQVISSPTLNALPLLSSSPPQAAVRQTRSWLKDDANPHRKYYEKREKRATEEALRNGFQAKDFSSASRQDEKEDCCVS